MKPRTHSNNTRRRNYDKQRNLLKIASVKENMSVIFGVKGARIKTTIPCWFDSETFLEISANEEEDEEEKTVG